MPHSKKGLTETPITGTGEAATKPVWKGYLTFGLVNLPIALYTCARPRESPFHLWCPVHQSRITKPAICIVGGERYDNYEALARCFEYAPEKHVEINQEELKALEPESSKRIEIQKFVYQQEVDPIWFETSYYISPEVGWEYPYGVLRLAMIEKQVCGLAKYTAHRRENAVLIRPLVGRRRMVMHSLFYEDEVPQLTAEAIPQVPIEAVTFAKRLIVSLTGEFNTSEFRDTYADAIKAVVDKKVSEVLHTSKSSQPPKPSQDLIADLKASIEKLKKGIQRP